LKRKKEFHLKRSLKSLSVILAIVFLFSGCATTTARGLDAEAIARQSPVASEQAVGDEIHREILSQFYPYTDPKVVKYVNDVGQDLARSAKRKELKYRFTILYNEKIYATSAPGGYVYVTTGMLNFLDNEAELAAVIAHEIAEQQYKDPRFTKQKTDMVNAASQAGAAIAPMFGPFGSLASIGIILLQAYSRTTQKTPEELLLESDGNAMKYLVASGYDPQALMDVLDHFLRAGEQVTPLFYDYYQSRPITEARMANLKKEFQKLPLSEKDLKTDALEYRAVTRGVREIYRSV
jgi:predicted Zn-dependent protease